MSVQFWQQRRREGDAGGRTPPLAGAGDKAAFHLLRTGESRGQAVGGGDWLLAEDWLVMALLERRRSGSEAYASGPGLGVGGIGVLDKDL
jgi:hypothetical protein